MSELAMPHRVIHPRGFWAPCCGGSTSVACTAAVNASQQSTLVVSFVTAWENERWQQWRRQSAEVKALVRVRKGLNGPQQGAMHHERRCKNRPRPHATDRHQPG